MPYKENYVFEKPTNLNQKIWHYLNLKKYLRLLDENSLAFTRSDLLGDKFEGSITQSEMELRRYYRKKWVKMVGQALPELTLDSILERDSETSRFLNKGIFINCWHMNPHESNAMWKIYSSDQEGIAIQSTYMKLRDSLNVTEEEVFIGKVLYKDLKKDIDPIDSYLRRIIRKEKSFAYERELRAVIVKWTDLLKKPLPDRILVSADLNLLIDRVVVYSTKSSFLEKIESVTRKHKLSKDVEKSVLAINPVF